MKYTLSSSDDRTLALVDHLETSEGHKWHFLTVDSKAKTDLTGAQVQDRNGLLEVLNKNSREVFPYSFSSQAGGGALSVATALGTLKFTISRGAISESGGALRGAKQVLKSSMPGKVIKLLVKPGDTVQAGQPLLVIEAMKMENEIRASHEAIIESIAVQSGQKVETGELLIKFATSK